MNNRIFFLFPKNETSPPVTTIPLSKKGKSSFPSEDKRYKWIILAFFEGACILAVELMGMRIISSFYGSSFVAFAAAISVTIVSLAMGYFLGGLIYALSSTGGILSSLLLGFWIIPKWGISFPMLIIALTMMLITSF